MTKDEVFAKWAPKGSLWTPWVKPVLFAQIDDAAAAVTIQPNAPKWIADALEVVASGHHRSSARSRDIAIMVDLPASDSVYAGLALAERGFFPVPLFNALPHLAALIEMQRAIDALIAIAPIRGAVSLATDAPPAFLLDSRRRGRWGDARPGRFDNRSVMFETDFPSADRLVRAGIRRVVVVQIDPNRPAVDLVEMLASWQTAGLTIQLKRIDDDGLPKPITVRRPSLLTRMAEWFARTTLRRDASGAFGVWIPPSPSGG